MNELQTLSRSEMKNIMAGVDPNTPCGGEGGGLCLVCTTPNGTESWCRSAGGESADIECQAIYPAHGSNVTGYYATCSGPGDPSVEI